MTTTRRTEANRANAQRSTGPKTPEGKKRVARNAVKHGLLAATTATLWDESPAAFDIHLARLANDLAPVGALEEALVRRIAALTWRLDRAVRVEAEILNYRAAAINSDSDRVAGQVFAREVPASMGRIASYEVTLDRGLHRALKELHELQDVRIVALPSIGHNPPPPPYPSSLPSLSNLPVYAEEEKLVDEELVDEADADESELFSDEWNPAGLELVPDLEEENPETNPK